MARVFFVCAASFLNGVSSSVGTFFLVCGEMKETLLLPTSSSHPQEPNSREGTQQYLPVCAWRDNNTRPCLVVQPTDLAHIHALPHTGCGTLQQRESDKKQGNVFLLLFLNWWRDNVPPAKKTTANIAFSLFSSSLSPPYSLSDICRHFWHISENSVRIAICREIPYLPIRTKSAGLIFQSAKNDRSMFTKLLFGPELH